MKIAQACRHIYASHVLEYTRFQPYTTPPHNVKGPIDMFPVYQVEDRARLFRSLTSISRTVVEGIAFFSGYIVEMSFIGPSFPSTSSVLELRAATPSTDIEIGPLPVPRSFLSRLLARVRLGYIHFKRKGRPQVAQSQTTEDGVLGIIGTIRTKLGEYLGSPTALALLSFSVRSSIHSGVVDVDWAIELGEDSIRVTNIRTIEQGPITSSSALGLHGLLRLTMDAVDDVLPASSSPDAYEPHTQLEDSPSTDGRLTLFPNPIPFTSLDREVSLIGPFEALRAYANIDRPPLAELSGSQHDVALNIKTLKPVADPTTASPLGELDVTLRSLATGSLASDFLQKLPSNSPPSSCDMDRRATSSTSINHGRDAERPRFVSSQANARRPSSDNEGPHSRAREYHRLLAVMGLERERRTVRAPAELDLGYIGFREELKQKLTGQGDECIWRGLKMQDQPRL